MLGVFAMVSPVLGADDPVLSTKSFEEVEKAWHSIAYTVFWFGVEVALLYGGVMSYFGLTHKSVSVVKGILISFVIVFVIKGILITIFT